MKSYDLIAIGTGSAMNLVDPFLRSNPQARVAVIDKDEPGGICLTRGCIPTKLLVHPADLVRHIESAKAFGIDARIEGIDFAAVMKRMREHIDPDIDNIRRALSSSPNIDYYHAPAKFVAPYRLEVAGQRIESRRILLCTGSKPTIPPIQGLEGVPYHTSDTILHLKERPGSMAIVGGGYIAAEFGHFFASMGTQVTIVGRNERFLPDEEPEISALAHRLVSQHMRVETGREVARVQRSGKDKVRVVARARTGGKDLELEVDLLLIAAGRGSNSDVLDPQAGGIKTSPEGWIQVNDFLETSQPGVYAMGDATGVLQFKHKANYDSLIVWKNAFGGRRETADYRFVPHAVFTHPEIAGVGLGERDAVKTFGRDGVRIGFYRYQDTAKGQALGADGPFVKVLVEAASDRIVGAHIIGPHASILLQEVITLMHATDATAPAVSNAMHIHPALPEVVERACGNLLSVEEYHATLVENGLESAPARRVAHQR